MCGFKAAAGRPHSRTVPRHGSIAVLALRHDRTDLGGSVEDAPLDTDIDGSPVSDGFRREKSSEGQLWPRTLRQDVR
ncbi:hypothetical protein E2C01_078645 [Portunus trituberculatus]|uniref:Uncharacterized protein n=1 Tax=Portunus trituberculatus TaxID=210409 RepID=A0A5B7IJC6_PORTR|nr:hypothetical protein [Portunus trituberculatus]